MLDAVKVLFILTGASTYLVTKYINVGIDANETKKNEIKDELNEGLKTELWNKTMNDNEYGIKALTVGGDEGQREGVMFILNGDGVDDENPSESKFAINAFTGELFLISALDRDPPLGRSQWMLNITAEDDRGVRLEGMAQIVVRVKDINDNAPHFPLSTYYANITENNESGVEIMTLSAEDFDKNDVIRYAVEMNRLNAGGELIFDINEASGVLNAAVCCLDREDIDQYTIKVCASDGSAKTCANVIVVVIDQNDELVRFARKSVSIAMNANEMHSRREIMHLSVVDNDLMATNSFVYRVVNESQFSDYFSVSTNSDGSASVVVVRDWHWDYDSNQTSQEFSVTICVSDLGHFCDDTRIDFCVIDFKIIRNKVKNVIKNPEVMNRTATDMSEHKFLFQTHYLYLCLLSIILILCLVVLIVIKYYLSHSSKVSANESRNESEFDLRIDGIRAYDSEGGGEGDSGGYDLTQLQIPIEYKRVLLLPDVCTEVTTTDHQKQEFKVFIVE